MKKYSKLLVFLAIILAFFVGFYSLKAQNRKINISNERVVKTFVASLTINGGGSVQKFDISGFIGKTALEATTANTKVITKGEGQNAFVTSINGVVADSNKRQFWELDVNGVEAGVGAGSYIIQNGDQIVWKINTY